MWSNGVWCNGFKTKPHGFNLQAHVSGFCCFFVQHKFKRIRMLHYIEILKFFLQYSLIVQANNILGDENSELLSASSMRFYEEKAPKRNPKENSWTCMDSRWLWPLWTMDNNVHCMQRQHVDSKIEVLDLSLGPFGFETWVVTCWNIETRIWCPSWLSKIFIANGSIAICRGAKTVTYESRMKLSGGSVEVRYFPQLSWESSHTLLFGWRWPVNRSAFDGSKMQEFLQ